MSQSWAAASSAARSPRSWPRTARACGSTNATSSPRAPPGGTPACCSTRWTPRSSTCSRRRSHYRELGHGFALPAEPAGVLVVGEDPAALERPAPRWRPRSPSCAPKRSMPRAADAGARAGRRAPAFRLATGWPVPPAAATRAFAARARAAGAELVEGAEATPLVANRRATGVRTAAAATGGRGRRRRRPLDPGLVDPAGGWRPIAPSWGVVVELRLAEPPRHALEEGGVETLLRPGGAPGVIFSLVTRTECPRSGRRSCRSSRTRRRWRRLLERGARFVPALAGAHATRCAPARGRRPSTGARCSARPRDGLYVAAGHGPWGSRSARARPGWSPTRCWADRR